MKQLTIQELAAGDTQEADSRGSAYSGYNLNPVKWLETINDAAKKEMFFGELVATYDLPNGNKEMIVPYRSKYLKTVRSGLAGSAGDWSVAVTNNGAALTATKINNLDGVVVAPTDKSAFVSIPNDVIRTKAVSYITAARDELTHHAGDEVDQEIAYIISTATASTSTASGSQRIYGGDAVADSGLTAGDILTTDMIADAKKRLMSRKVKYWSGTEGTSSAEKPTWRNDASDPFVVYLAPEQENGFLKDSQFVNAAEYGGNEVLMNGEIGKYLGIRMVTSTNTPQVAASGTAFDGGSAPTVDITRCIMMKPKAAAALVWGIRPRIITQEFPRELSTDIIMEMSYAAKTIHNDAIVFLDVADE